MKKIISVLLVLFLSLYLLPVSYAIQNPSIRGSEVSAGPGDTVELPVYVTDNPGFSYLKIAFTYDHDALTLIKIENGDVSADAFTKTSSSLSWDTGEDTTSNGLLCTFTFTINNSAVNDYTIGLRVVSCYNLNEESVSFISTNGRISVTEENPPAIKGDEVTSSPGDTVEIPVYVTDNPGFSYVKIAYTYDHDALTLVKIENGNVSTDAFTKTSSSLSWDTGEDTTINGILCTFTFSLNDNVSGDYIIGLRVVSCYNINEDAVNFVSIDGKITVHTHTWNAGEITTAPTCKDTGIKTFTCTVCGETKTETVAKDANNHDGSTEVRNAKEATCGEDGYTGDTYCLGCGAKIATGTVVPKTGNHTWDAGEITTVPTCKSTGVKTFTCTVCGETKTEAVAKDANNHVGGTEVRNAKDATCGEDGYTGDTYCLGCGAKLATGTVIAKTGKHTWNAGEITTVPTCKSTGVKTFTCTVCGETKTETVAKDANNHDGSTEVRNAKEATCGEDGYTGDTYCLGCGAKLSSGTTIPATGNHTWNVGLVTQEPTSDSSGIKIFTCTVCGTTREEPIPPVHSSTGTISITDTSAHSGDTITIPITVSNNPGFSYLKLAYNYDHEALSLVKVENGVVSTDSFTETASALSWDSSEDTMRDGILCTLTFAINNKVKGDYSIELRVVNSYNNNEEDVSFITQNGKISVTKVEHTHSWDNGKVTKNATCAEEGIMTYTCKICGETKTEAIEKLTTHSFGEWIVDTPATITTEGSAHRICSVCNLKETKVLPKEDLNVLFGDVNHDGRVTSADARLALRRAVELEHYEKRSYEFFVSDVDFDGKVTSADARLILRAAVDLEDPNSWLEKYKELKNRTLSALSSSINFSVKSITTVPTSNSILIQVDSKHNDQADVEMKESRICHKC